MRTISVKVLSLTVNHLDSSKVIAHPTVDIAPCVVCATSRRSSGSEAAGAGVLDFGCELADGGTHVQTWNPLF